MKHPNLIQIQIYNTVFFKAVLNELLQSCIQNGRLPSWAQLVSHSFDYLSEQIVSGELSAWKDLQDSSSSFAVQQKLLELAHTQAIGNLDSHDVNTNTSTAIGVQSIFTILHNYNGDKLFHLPTDYTISETIFATHTLGDSGDKKHCELLLKNFNEEWSAIPKAQPLVWLNNTFYVFKKYASYIALPLPDSTGLSLFDVLKASTAYLVGFVGKQGGDAGNGTGVGAYRFFCCDVSGIQKFIYQISSQAAAKSLRGRSFYVQALLDGLTLELLNRVSLSHYQIVYAAGGKVYLLLPDDTATIDSIEIFLCGEIRDLWQQFAGSLWLNFAHLPFEIHHTDNTFNIKTPNSDTAIAFNELWKQLAQLTAAGKWRRMIHITSNEKAFAGIFQPFGAGGTEEVCAVTGQELTTDVQVKLPRLGTDNEQIWVHKQVQQQILLGEQLRNHWGLAFANNSATANAFTLTRASTLKVLLSKNEIAELQSGSLLQTLTTQSLGSTFFANTHIVHGFRLYGGYQVAQNSYGDAKTHDELADNGSFKQLGVLRLDVDNLGQLFMNGLPEQKRSLPYLARLSDQMNLFFSGYLNTLKGTSKYKDWVNIVYAGGDDLFAVGHWDLLIEFAIDIRKEFTKWVGGNHITLSAGVAMVRPRFPIAKAAELAGEAEEYAKMFPYLDTDEIPLSRKNAFHFLGVTVSWEREIDFVVSFKEFLVAHITERIINKSVLMRLFSFYEMYKAKDIQWRWRAVYSLSRYAAENNKENARYAVEKLKILLFANQYEQHNNVRFEAIILAARWAELCIRNKNNS